MRGRLSRTDVLVLCVVLIWAASFSVVKFGLREMGPLSFATLRFTAGALFLLAWVCVVEGRPTIRREDWLRVVLVGLTAIGVYQAFFTVGLKYTTASNSSLMLATIPAWTALFAAGSGQETVSRFQIVGILFSFVGVAAIIRGGDGQLAMTSETLAGDAMTIVAAGLSGLSTVLSKRLLSRYSSLRVMSVAMVCGSLFLVAISVPEMATQEWTHISASTWLALAFSAVPAAGFAYMIWFKSIGEIGASRTVIYNNLIPPVAIVIAVSTLGETFTPLQAAGAVIVIAGVTLARFAHARSARAT
jgi:drug/metabolite transporter (DMT)-like permease